MVQTEDEADDEVMKPFFELDVVDPISYSSPFFVSYTTFNVKIMTNNPAFSLPRSEVRRRFSEFSWLRRVLQRHHPEREPPHLPTSGLFVWNRFSSNFLEERREGLKFFLDSVVSIPVYLGERALHLFLQSSLETDNIEANLIGERDDQVGDPHLTSFPSFGSVKMPSALITSPECVPCVRTSIECPLASPDDGYQTSGSPTFTQDCEKEAVKYNSEKKMKTQKQSSSGPLNDVVCQASQDKNNQEYIPVWCL